MTYELNEETLKARVFHALEINNLNPEEWEKIICDAMDAAQLAGKIYFDGILVKSCLNIKTLKQNPTILKRKENRDFLSNTEHFPRNVTWVQRRTNLPPHIDEFTSSPSEIINATFESFKKFEDRSYKKFDTTNTLDVVVRYGIDKTGNRYIVDVDILNHKYYDINDLECKEVLGGKKSLQANKRVAVEAYLDNKIVAKRNGSNSGIYQTNYVIYRDLDESIHDCTINIPMPKPKPLTYNREKVLQDIKALENASTH